MTINSAFSTIYLSGDLLIEKVRFNPQRKEKIMEEKKATTIETIVNYASAIAVIATAIVQVARQFNTSRR